MNKFVRLILVIGLAVFLFIGLALSKRGRLMDCSPDNTLNSAFFIGDDMITCKVESCDNKYSAKGLCKKHYKKQYYLNNKEQITIKKNKYN